MRSVLLLLSVAFVSPIAAQELTLASAAPRFLSTPTAATPAADVSNAPVFQRRVTLEMDRVPLKIVLDAIGRQAGLSFIASPENISLDALVSVSASHITVAAALTELLVGKGVDVELARDGAHAAIVPRPGAVRAPLQQSQRGTIAGQVTDAALRTPLAAVSVRVEGTSFGTSANADGRYTISGVSPGTYRVTARRVGYQPLTKDISIAADQSATLDFALIAAPTRLDEVVTTAVGQQRRYEVGNDISTINADSIAPTAPITSLTDLISARAPGVTVLETSGMVGSGEAIRIEGLTSLVLQNNPILIVDGVRQDNSAGGQIYAVVQTGGGSHPTPTRLNDIDFSDIESIDILKGPSALTEYGTDAANGVIIITTKHGTAGQPQWKASAEQTESDIPERFPNGIYGWGHTTDGTNTPVNCTLISNDFTTSGSTSGACVVDSLTQWNPLNHSATSIFGTGNRAKYDLSVNGGSDAVRYFVSGSVANETGMIRMPPVYRELADTASLGLPSAALNSNGEQQRSVRVNTAIKLGSTADLTATGSYLSTYQQTPSAGELYLGSYAAPALNTAANNYGYTFYTVANGVGFTPLQQLSNIGSQNTDRMTGGLTASWRPTGWFVGHATAGLDHGSQQTESIGYPLANVAYDQQLGSSLGVANSTTDIYSVDLRGTATASLMRTVRAVTSAGLQLVDTRTAGQAAVAPTITPTNLTLNGATGTSVTQQADRQATLGGYGEEQLSIADRLFLTGALRIDAASGFGSNYATAAYPKASVSWLAIQGPTTVHVRGAFGESGVQPTNGAALQLYTPTVAYLNGAAVSVNQVNWPGNPSLRPERSAEFEGGLDVTTWKNRVSMELTAYSKTTHDALVNESLGWDLGGYTYQENIGTVQNTGLEGSATIGLIQSRPVTWDLAVNAFVNNNKLVSLAPGVPAQLAGNFVGSYAERQAPGYPLYGLWAQRVTYVDANHDGIIEPTEVLVADSASYVGPSLPTQEISVSTHIGFLRGTITVGGLADYRGGYRIFNNVGAVGDLAGNSLAMNDPTAPLWLQARRDDLGVNGNSYGVLDALYEEDGSFIRLREASITYAVPRGVIRALRVRSFTVTVAGRNLILWTRYPGVDPETSNAGGIDASPTTNGYTVNNDERADNGAVPLARYFVVRINAGL